MDGTREACSRLLEERLGKGEVEAGIESLHATRDADPYRRLLPRLAARMRLGTPTAS